MKILCQSCAAKYTIADEKVVGKVIKIKCKKCGATIVVNGNDPSTLAASNAISGAANTFDDNAATQLMSQPPPDGGAGSGNPDEWTVSVTDDDQRTLTTQQIVDGYRAGQIPGDAFVWRDGMGDWLPLSNVPDLMALMGNGGSAASYGAAAAPMPAAAAGASFGGGYEAPAPMPAAAAAPTPAAVTPAPAAAARRAGGRGGGGVDLFGGGGGGIAAAHVGERNETSVLFSIGALKAAEEEARRADVGGGAKRPSPPLKGRAAVSDDRVDDILSLGPAPAGPSLAPPPMLAPIVEAPPPPPPPPQQTAMMAGPASTGYPMGGAAPYSMAPAAEKKGVPVGIVVGGGVVALAAIGGLVFMLTRGGPKPADTTAKPNDTSAPVAVAKTDDTSKAAPTPTDTASAATTDTAKADDTASPDDSAKPDSTGKIASTGPLGTGKIADTKKDDTKKDDTKKDDTKKDDTKKDDTKKDDGAAGTAEFDRGAASAQLSAKAGGASGCKKPDGPTGSGKVMVTFAPSGHVTSVNVGPPFAGTPVGSCIAGVFHSAAVPPFSGSAMTVSKTVSIK